MATGRTILDGLEDLEYWEWPANAVGVVISTLRNREGALAQRELAARVAAEAASEEAVAEELLARCRDREDAESVRAQAASSLGVTLATFEMDGGFDGGFDWESEDSISSELASEIQEVLREVWEDESDPLLVRRRALEGSVRCPDDWHKGAVRKAYEADDDDLQLTAVFCMHYVAGFEQEILAAINDARPWVQIEAVRAAGARELRKAWPTVEKILQAGNPGGDTSNPKKVLYLTAIEALPGVAKKSVANRLLDELCESSDEDVAAVAEEAKVLSGGGLWL